MGCKYLTDPKKRGLENQGPHFNRAKEMNSFEN